ncbi:hypothetical protein B0H66DRAFT_546142 [Apodospora peruviana]|uniref:Uncharacterized protein n=1 Tax=Apodospora peruviana TaxID=516989 RepID=A0AAE0IU14_9PEZI|nr:hypothetical protein B0H66DRAFT_571466 [Apodospora peruviana]KAK3331239.1 hypothetical protein B0H66DRAFT_546142 [Apodospora peruviana]
MKQLPFKPIFTFILLRIGAISYNRSLAHYTLEPIEEICLHQSDHETVKRLLHDFKARKKQEISFVRSAATLSAAAVIGAFSWPAITDAFWLATLLWQSSLWLSVFALISSAQDTLLEQIPDRLLDLDLSGAEVNALLRIVLKTSAETSDNDHPGNHLVADGWLIWVWQTPMMLMSLSWVAFLVGYALYIITPFINNRGTWTVHSTTAVISLIVGAGVVLNFYICSILARRSVKHVKTSQMERELNRRMNTNAEMEPRWSTDEPKGMATSKVFEA